MVKIDFSAYISVYEFNYLRKWTHCVMKSIESEQKKKKKKETTLKTIQLKAFMLAIQ